MLLLCGCRCASPDDVTRAPFDNSQAIATVLMFVRTDCPIVNAYAPRLEEIHRDFARHNLQFCLVYPEPSDSEEAIERHIREYSLPGEFLRDEDRRLVSLAGATVTPEVAVFLRGSGEPKLIYSGRIDDQYVDWGKRREVATMHDLRNVLDRLVSGETVPFRRTEAVGCAIH